MVWPVWRVGGHGLVGRRVRVLGVYVIAADDGPGHTPRKRPLVQRLDVQLHHPGLQRATGWQSGPAAALSRRIGLILGIVLLALQRLRRLLLREASNRRRGLLREGRALVVRRV